MSDLFSETLREFKYRVVRENIIARLNATSWNVKEAAKGSGQTAKAFYLNMRRYGVKPKKQYAPRNTKAVRKLAEALSVFERTYLKQLLKDCDNNISAVARYAGRSRTGMYKVLFQHGLMPRTIRGNSAWRELEK